MKLKNALKLFFATSCALILSGCLPAQKTTQCGKNEAYNATRRTCVPVIGSASTSTVFVKSKLPANNYTTSINGTTVVHSIAVSDVYNYGYSSKWFLHYSSGAANNTVQVGTNVLSYNFNPAFVYGAGAYILEAAIYNPDDGTFLDSVSWNITVNGDVIPTITNPIPGAGAFSYASNLTSANLSVDLLNPDGLDGNYTWLVDGVQTATGSFSMATTSLSTSINPQALGVGIHTVEVKLAHLFNPSNIYDTYVWVVNVVNPDLPILTTADPGFNFTILAIDYQSYGSASGGFFYDHDGDGSQATPLENIAVKAQTGYTPGICVSVDNWDKNGDTVADIYLKFDINGSQQGPLVYLTANEYCITSDLSTQILANSEIGVSKTLTVSTYQNGTNVQLEQKSWAMNVLPKNSAPVIQISSNSDSFGCSAASNVYHTGCSITQSVDNDQNGSYADAGDVDNVVKLAIDVLQDYETDYNNDANPYGEDQTAVYFQIKKSGDAGYQDVDGTSAYTKAACSVASGASKATVTDSSTPTGAITTYYCNLSLDAFNANGPIESGDYIVKAYVTDAGSVWSGIPKDSNSVIWDITVNEYQSAPQIQNQDFAGGSIAGNESYFTLSADGSGCTDSGTVLYSANNVSESDYVILHTLVKDLERDNLTVSIKMENLVAGAGSYSSVSGLQSVTRVDGNEYVEVKSCFKIPEWANTSGTNQVGVQVNVTDVPDNAATALSDSNTGADVFLLNVININPPPTFADYAGSENIKNLDGTDSPSQIYAFAGYPFTLTPPAYTDASVFDGNVVSWQWQVCVGDPATTCDLVSASWANIPNADSSSQSSEQLNWTPDPSIASNAIVNLRICLGDNGDGNPADCSDDPESRKTYTNIIANPNSTLLSAATSEGAQVASWFDQTDGFQYVAYESSGQIVVEKLSNDGNGVWSQVHSTRFDSDVDGQETVYDLSITGQDQTAVLVAYRVYKVIGAATSPVARVRRIDISAGKLSFNEEGLFDETDAGDLDMIAGAGKAGAEAMFASGVATFTMTGFAGERFDISFSALPTAGETVTFRPSDAAGDITFTYNSAQWCSGGCLDAAATATALSNAINSDPRLSQEVSASALGSVVSVSGPGQNDFVDIDSELAMSLGNILVQTNNTWYLPFADGSTASKVSIITGTAPGTTLNGFPVASTALNTKAAVTELKSDINSSGQFVVATKAEGNLHAYLIEQDLSAVSAFNEYVYSIPMNGFSEIKNISISVDPNDVVFVAGVSMTSGGETSLNAAVFSPDLSQVSATPAFNGTMNYLAQPGIDHVAIAASSAGDGSAVIALTTSSAHADIPNQAHMALISQNTADYTQSIAFTDYQIATSLSSPKLNASPTVDGSKIAISPMMDLTKGHSDDAASVNTQPSVFLSFHENNGTNQLRSGIFNASPESITTDEDGVSGSYPAFISN